MAMNKAEKKEQEQLLRELASFKRTPPTPPDIPIPDNFADIHLGYSANECSGVVEKAWSSRVSHGSGHEKKGIATQNGRSLYSKKSLALLAIRRAREQRFAREVFEIDQRIAEALAEEENGPRTTKD